MTRFLIGVTTTGVVCRPGCGGRPHARNAVVLGSLAEARSRGLRPCLRCRPDEHESPPGAPVRLGTRSPFDSDALIAFLAARAVPGVERVEGRRYARRLRLRHGLAELALELRDDGVDVVTDADPRDAADVVARVRALLDLDADAPAIDAHLACDPALRALVHERPGVRAPGIAERHEALARAIVGQQISVAGARTLLGRIAADHGHDGCFPDAAELAAADPATLPLPRRRAACLVGAMEAVAGDPALLGDPERLVTLPGVGAWTAGYVALRTGDRDAFLGGDLVARRALARRRIGDTSRWRPYRAYALHRLWVAECEG